MASLSSDTLPEIFCSVDVECVATGRRHDEFTPAIVAVVNKDESTLLKRKVKPDKPVVSYLTPVTGLVKGDLDDGERLIDVMEEVKSLLGPDVVLVGQGIKNDINWLQLRKGIDFSYTVDLAQIFKVYNSVYGNCCYFSLQHEANTLLGPGTITEQHDPSIDALASIKLFKKYYTNPSLAETDKKRLLKVRAAPSFAKQNNYSWEGVCLAGYMPRKCFCGAPTLRDE